MRTKTCRFGPFTGVLAPDAPVRILNEDPMKHTIQTFAVRGRRGNILKTLHNRDVRPGTVFEETFETGKLKESRVVRLRCNRHDFMQNWLYTVKTPYFAISDEQGRFLMDQVPPGRYELVAWHPLLGLHKQSVTVEARQTREVSFEFSGTSTGKQGPRPLPHDRPPASHSVGSVCRNPLTTADLALLMRPRRRREPTVSPRKAQRFAVQIPTYFTGENITGEGTIVNLSPEGCAILSKENPRLSSYLSVRIDLSERDAPLLIDLAAVRWISDERIGLEFIRMGETDQERLRQFVKTLEVRP